MHIYIHELLHTACVSMFALFLFVWDACVLSFCVFMFVLAVADFHLVFLCFLLSVLCAWRTMTEILTFSQSGSVYIIELVCVLSWLHLFWALAYFQLVRFCP